MIHIKPQQIGRKKLSGPVALVVHGTRHDTTKMVIWLWRPTRVIGGRSFVFSARFRFLHMRPRGSLFLRPALIHTIQSVVVCAIFSLQCFAFFRKFVFVVTSPEFWFRAVDRSHSWEAKLRKRECRKSSSHEPCTPCDIFYYKFFAPHLKKGGGVSGR